MERHLSGRKHSYPAYFGPATFCNVAPAPQLAPHHSSPPLVPVGCPGVEEEALGRRVDRQQKRRGNECVCSNVAKSKCTHESPQVCDPRKVPVHALLAPSILSGKIDGAP